MKEWFIDEIQEAWQLATKMHDGQKYGGSNPNEQIEYLNHIGSVVFEIMKAIAIEHMNSDLAIKCAILHDTIEDTALTYTDILNKFGAEVADGVLALTKDVKIPEKKDKMLDSLTRIKQQPKEIWAVKMADRISNLYAPPFYWKNKKKIDYLEESKIIYCELQQGSSYLGNRLDEKIKIYQKFI